MLYYINNSRFALASGGRERAVKVSRKTLFESETLQIGLFEARPSSDPAAMSSGKTAMSWCCRFPACSPNMMRPGIT